MNDYFHTQYDWESGLGGAFATVGVTVDGSEPVNVATPAYFQQLHTLINQTNSTYVEFHTGITF